MPFRPRRSALYLPASNPRAIEKARTLPCDVVILDLEDAVAPEAKAGARRRRWRPQAAGFGGRELVIRINALDSEWGADDLAALAARSARCGAGAQGVERGRPRPRSARRCPDMPLWAMIETPAALLRLDAIARGAGRWRRWWSGPTTSRWRMRARVDAGAHAVPAASWRRSLPPRARTA